MYYNEYELIYLYIYEYSDKAFNLLVKKFSGIIKHYIFEFRIYSNYDDFYQVGLITLYRCIIKYDMDSTVPFLPYFVVSLKRTFNREMNNLYLPFNSTSFEENNIYDKSRLVFGEKSIYYEFENLELRAIEKAALNEILMDSISREEFAKKHNMDIKQVYNLVYRLKAKLKKSIKIN